MSHRTTDADTAIADLPESGHFAMGFYGSQPPALLAALARRARSGGFKNARLYYAHASPAMAESIFHDDVVFSLHPHTLFPGHHDRALFDRGRADGRKRLYFVPTSFSQMPRVVSEFLELDAFLVQAAPPDRGGYLSLGTIGAFSLAAARSAKRLIVEINRHMPRTDGCTIHISQAHAVVEHESPLPELLPRQPDDTDRQIANLVAPLVPNGACVQFGIGGVPAAVADLLHNHNDLGVHTELLSDSVMNLIQKGVVTNRRKGIDVGRSVYNIAMGSQAFYDALHENAGVLCRPADYVNAPDIIAKNDTVISINAFLEVDLTGQVNAEAVAGRQFSAAGGQLDFVRGAALSRGGKSIIAAHSSAAGGKCSRIVPRLTGPSTDPRMDVQFIATEHGVADLRGRSTTERARALIAIAHPSFRAELEQQAHALFLT